MPRHTEAPLPCWQLFVEKGQGIGPFTKQQIRNKADNTVPRLCHGADGSCFLANTLNVATAAFTDLSGETQLSLGLHNSPEMLERFAQDAKARLENCEQPGALTEAIVQARAAIAARASQK